MSDLVFDELVKPLKLGQGFSSPAIAAVLGALAGHASQVAAFNGVATGDPAYAGLSIATVNGRNGDVYLFGDAVNRPVLEWEYSVWSLVAGVCEKMGIPIPDRNELAGYVASTVGTDNFGIPRDLPTGSPTPRDALALWATWNTRTANALESDYVPVAFAMAFQRLAQTDNAVDPTVDQAAMGRIMMESTLAMSKLQAPPGDLLPAPTGRDPRSAKR
jgi:hypothetical protein